MPKDNPQELERMWHFKQSRAAAIPTLGEEMVAYFKQTVRQRQTKLAKIAPCWATLVPESLSDHCVLHGLTRGTLTVLVDSAPHLYELRQLLLAGLEDQLLLACKSGGLRKIVLRPGSAPTSENRRRTGDFPR